MNILKVIGYISCAVIVTIVAWDVGAKAAENTPAIRKTHRTRI